MKLKFIKNSCLVVPCLFFLVTFIQFKHESNIAKAAERQNLDEALARKSRFANSTFYSGESGSPYYFWQSETLNYTDQSYDTEVWRVVFKPGISDNFSKEYSTQAFNYDGGKIGIWSCVPVWNSPNRRVSSDPNKDGGDCTRWVVNSDGTKLRIGTGKGYSFDNDGFNWMNTESSYLFSPMATYDPAGAKFGQIYKVSVDDNNSMTRSLLYDTDDGRRTDITLKDALTSDDKWLVLQDNLPATWPTPNGIDSKRLSFFNMQTKTIDNAWGVARGIGPVGDPYGSDVGTNEIGLRGSSSAFVNPGDLVYAHYNNFTPHFLWSRNGSASDDGPLYEDWNGTSFGLHDEIRAVDDNAALSTELPHNPYGNGYMGHPAFDRWGHYVLGDSSQDCGAKIFGTTQTIRWGSNSCPGLLVLDVKNNLANPSWVDSNNSNYMLGTGNSNVYGASHSSWTGWTDVITSINGLNHQLFINNYQKTNQIGKNNYQATKYFASPEIDGFYFDNYAANPRPSQSPDGTKVAFSTILFHSAYAGISSDDDFTSTAYAVAYYPYPPQIKSASKNNNNILLTWDFNQGTAENPNHLDARTYTQRGWPDEITDRPPSPREIKQFRIWSSDDNLSWTPIGTINYNNRAGAWTETSWSFDITQPNNATKYYAITALEFSGLESHTLSNTWKVTTDSNGNIIEQTEQSAYSSDPGGKSNFYQTKPDVPQNVSFAYKQAPASADGQYTITWNAPANKDMIRYYNIYAHDGSVPEATQQMRIASIAAASDYANTGNFKYVDWLGNSDGSTKYIVTAVDYHGNESVVDSLLPLSFSFSNFLQLRNDWFKSQSSMDLNTDNIINPKDLGIMMSKWN